MRVFSWKSDWNLTFCSFFVQKPVKITRCTFHKKPLRFVKSAVVLYWVFPENRFEISRFVFFSTKNRLKHKMYLAYETATVWKNCSSIIRGFAWKLAWNLTFCSFLSTNWLKKHAVPSIKTVTFCEKCRSIILGFLWKSVWNLTFWTFLDKNRLKNKCTNHIKPLRFGKIVVLL